MASEQPIPVDRITRAVRDALPLRSTLVDGRTVAPRHDDALCVWAEAAAAPGPRCAVPMGEVPATVMAVLASYLASSDDEDIVRAGVWIGNPHYEGLRGVAVCRGAGPVAYVPVSVRFDQGGEVLTVVPGARVVPRATPALAGAPAKFVRRSACRGLGELLAGSLIRAVALPPSGKPAQHAAEGPFRASFPRDPAGHQRTMSVVFADGRVDLWVSLPCAFEVVACSPTPTRAWTALSVWSGGSVLRRAAYDRAEDAPVQVVVQLYDELFVPLPKRQRRC